MLKGIRFNQYKNMGKMDEMPKGPDDKSAEQVSPTPEAVSPEVQERIKTEFLAARERYEATNEIFQRKQAREEGESAADWNTRR